MHAEYRRDLRHHFLVIYGEGKLEHDAYQIRMIQENQMEGFAECHTERIDEKVLYFYQVTSRQSLEELARNGGIGTELLRTLLQSVFHVLREVNEYLLPQDGLLLAPEYIFTDAAQNSFSFCYYPEKEETAAESLKGLAEYLLPLLDESDRDAVVLGFSFYQACAGGNMTETRFRELLYADGTGQQTVFEQAAGTSLPEKKRTREDAEALAREEERSRILDAFFAEDEDAEEEASETRLRMALWFAGMILLAVGAAAALAWAGWIQTGLGVAVLIIAAAVFLWRSSEKFSVFRKVREPAGTDMWADGTLAGKMGMDWRTYDERAGELLAEKNPPGRTKSHRSSRNHEDAKQINAPIRPAENEGADGPSGLQQGILRQMFPEEPAVGGLESEETTWLGTGSPESLPCARLIRTGTAGEEQYSLIQPEHLVGKSSAAADIVLDSAAVSRFHARLAQKESGYAVTDMRSKNGTFLNEEILAAGAEYPLKSGDVIRFADCAFLYEQI